MPLWVLIYLAVLLVLGSSSAFSRVKQGTPVWLAAWDIVSTGGLVYLVALYFNPHVTAPAVAWLWTLAGAVALSEAICMWRARPLVAAELAAAPPEVRETARRMAWVLAALYYGPAAVLIAAALNARS